MAISGMAAFNWLLEQVSSNGDVYDKEPQNFQNLGGVVINIAFC